MDKTVIGVRLASLGVTVKEKKWKRIIGMIGYFINKKG